MTTYKPTSRSMAMTKPRRDQYVSLFQDIPVPTVSKRKVIARSAPPNHDCLPSVLLVLSSADRDTYNGILQDKGQSAATDWLNRLWSA